MGLDHEKVVPISFSNRFLDENTLGICYEASEKKKKKKNELVNYVSAKVKPSLNYPAAIYLLKVNNRNTGTRCKICSKLTIKTPERRH